MNEKLLQYIWNFRIFSRLDFSDINGNMLEILNFGIWNGNSEPDFLMAKIKINNIILAGNIEFHVKSSDWIFHKHSENQEFNNIILHVVYLHDCDIEELLIKNIPTLELRHFIDPQLFSKYQKMMIESHFIPCEKVFNAERVPFQFTEHALLQKLNEKSIQYEIQLQHYKNDFEALLFYELAYSFGLKVNAEIFRNIAENISYSVIRKIRNNTLQINAIFYGKAGWLNDPKDEKMRLWKREYDFIRHKHKLSDITFSPKFLRLRPPNFPTIRLSQFAKLLHENAALFSRIIEAENTEQLQGIFSTITAEEYWDSHYNFSKKSKKQYPKGLTQDFVNLILINSVLPLKYTWMKNETENATEKILNFYQDILTEKNRIIDSWKGIGVTIQSALHSQAYLYHYKNFCLQKKCLNCGIGLKILKRKT